MPLRPIPETIEALDELEASADGDAMLAEFTDLAARAQSVVPDLLGVSISPVFLGLTFTLVANAAEVAVLDAVQYVAGGPCVETAGDLHPREFRNQDVLDEEAWRMFAQATAAHCVRSTLSLPVLDEDRVVATINLYAASDHAFGGHHDELAGLFGAWTAGAVTNADLSFSTRDDARAAPRLARETAMVEAATGIIAADLDIEVDAAEDRLRDAAARGGVTPAELAREIVRIRNED